MSDGPLMVLDVGNTHTVCGVFVGEDLVEDLRLSTATDRTADEYGALLLPLFRRLRLDPTAVCAMVISSVVPPLHRTFAELGEKYFHRRPLFVEPGIRTGLPMRYDNPAEVGADRIVNSLAARELYGAPAVVVDFGTATTFDVVNAAGEYAGGIIAPGIGVSAEALFSHAARLFRVDIVRPDELVGRNTVGAIQSGLYFGYLSLVDGILERLLDELGPLRTCIATGGHAELIAPASRFIREVDPRLTLLGLKLIHERNR